MQIAVDEMTLTLSLTMTVTRAGLRLDCAGSELADLSTGLIDELIVQASTVLIRDRV